jgi:hypothetical protein
MTETELSTGLELLILRTYLLSSVYNVQKDQAEILGDPN